MGNCPSNLNCNADIYSNHAKEPLVVDPDIAGPGVLASFIISAGFALLAIAFGYFTDSLPRRHLHKLDRVFIRQSREAWIFRKLGPKIKRVLQPLRRAADKSNVFRIRPNAVPREIRSEALLRFLLVNSDQQLVTGLAVLIGGLARSLSGYEFQQVASLAWFSTTTHLATLAVLTNYFREHPEVLIIRLIGMGATLAILSFVMTVDILKDSYPRAPWQCAIGNLSTDSKRVFVTFLLLLYLIGAFVTRIINLMVNAHRTKLELREKAKDISRQLSELSKANLAPAEFQEKKKELSSQLTGVSHHDSHEESGFINSYAKMVLWLYAYTTRALPKGPDFHRLLNIALENAEHQRDAYFESATRLSTKKYWILVADLLSVDYCNSFAFGFSVLVFAFSFGIAQTIQAKNYTNGIHLDEGVTEWGFGQIVPLFLLALPMLAATEIYCESRRKAHSHFYALAIAEGEEEAKSDSGELTRTDTTTPQKYTHFFNEWYVRYGLRLTIWTSIAALAFAGAAVEVSITAVGDIGATIISVIIAFAIYATMREVYLVRKGMLEIIQTKAAVERPATVQDKKGERSPSLNTSDKDGIHTVVSM